MQVEEQNTEGAQQPTPEEETRGLLPKEEERKKELVAKKAQKEKRHERLTKVEAKELEALLTIEKLEYDRQAAIHKLSETADTFGRRAIGQIKRTVTDQVKQLHVDEKTETAGIFKIYRRGMAEADKELKTTMQKIQERHNELLGKFKRERDKDEGEIRARYRKEYDGHEAQMTADMDEVAALVSDFLRDIRGMELEPLQELLRAGIVQVGGNDKNRDYLVVPGSDK